MAITKADCKKEGDKWMCLEGEEKISYCKKNSKSEAYIIGIS